MHRAPGARQERKRPLSLDSSDTDTQHCQKRLVPLLDTLSADSVSIGRCIALQPPRQRAVTVLWLTWHGHGCTGTGDDDLKADDLVSAQRLQRGKQARINRLGAVI